MMIRIPIAAVHAEVKKPAHHGVPGVRAMAVTHEMTAIAR